LNEKSLEVGLMAVDQPIDALEVYRLKTHQHLTFKQIGILESCSPQGAHQAFQRFVASLPPTAQLQSFEEAKPQLLSAAQQKLLASCADDDKIAKMSVRDAAVAFGILFDKQRLATNQSTSNISMLSKLISQADHGLFHVEPSKDPAKEG